LYWRIVGYRWLFFPHGLSVSAAALAQPRQQFPIAKNGPRFTMVGFCSPPINNAKICGKLAFFLSHSSGKIRFTKIPMASLPHD